MKADRAAAARSLVAVSAGDSSGAGVRVGERLVLTCEHVVRGAASVEVRARVEADSGRYSFVDMPATVKKVDTKRDLALLDVQEGVVGFAFFAEVAHHEPDLYDQVTIAACTNGLHGVAVDGVLQGIKGSADAAGACARDYLVSGLAAHGSSGGGVFNLDGGLIGIVKAFARDDELSIHQLCYAASLRQIRAFLKGEK